MTARQRTRDLFVYVVGVVVVIGIIASFFVTRSEVSDVGSRVTKVESPCLHYGPKSPQCKAAFEAAVATITHPEACAIERKAGTLKAIRELAASLEVTFKEPCAGARLAQERQRGNERQATAHNAADGGTAAPVSTQVGSDQAPPEPGKGGTGGGSGPDNSGAGKGGSAPDPSAAGESPDQPSGTGGSSQGTPESSAPESSTGSSAGSLPGVVEAVGKAGGEVVGKAGDAVQGSAEGLGKGLGDTLGSGR